MKTIWEIFSFRETSQKVFVFGTKQQKKDGVVVRKKENCKGFVRRRNEIYVAHFLEILREHQRNINRAMREIERERVGLQTQEKKITMEMKKLAKQGQMVCFLIEQSSEQEIREQ